MSLVVHLQSRDERIGFAMAADLVVEHRMDPVELDLRVGVQEPGEVDRPVPGGDTSLCRSERLVSVGIVILNVIKAEKSS